MVDQEQEDERGLSLFGVMMFCLAAFLGLVAGQALQRHLQRLEKIEREQWNAKLGERPVGLEQGREMLRQDVREAVKEALLEVRS